MRNIVLTGFMGTGKSTIGRHLSRRLDMPLIDTDQLIAKQAGKPITQIFEEDGEAAFRAVEAEVCQQAARSEGHVIATGGGAVLNIDTAEALAANGVLICLTADIETIMGRVGQNPGRPLFQNYEGVLKLMSERAKVYAMLPHHVDTTDRTPEESTDEVIRIWKQSNSE